MLAIIGTFNDSIGSIGIRYFLDEPISHIAFMFDERIVIHSTIAGVKLISAKEFNKHQNIYTIKRFSNLTLEQEEEVFQSLLKVKDAEYDKSAFAYFTFCAIRRKMFKIPLPKENPFGDKNKYLCTELAGLLPDFLFNSVFNNGQNPFKGQDLEIITPYQTIKEII